MSLFSFTESSHEEAPPMPYLNSQEAEEASQAFDREVKELAKKYRINNLVVLSAPRYIGDDNNAHDAVTVSGRGDVGQCSRMVSFALGFMSTRESLGLQHYFELGQQAAHESAEQAKREARRRAERN